MSHEKNCSQKVETRDRKTIVILYFDQITRDGVCPEIKAIREQKVEQLKTSPIKVYDYYNPGKDKYNGFSSIQYNSLICSPLQRDALSNTTHLLELKHVISNSKCILSSWPNLYSNKMMTKFCPKKFGNIIKKVHKFHDFFIRQEFKLFLVIHHRVWVNNRTFV